MIGIIGGSGLYEIEGFEKAGNISVQTPFGKPSDEFVEGTLAGAEVVFLPRHGRGHVLSPSEINYQANIFGMKKLGVETIVSISAVGSFKDNLRPRDICLPDQFIDRTTHGRAHTFFSGGIVAHVSFGDPVCAHLRRIIQKACTDIDVTVHPEGTYINMEGPTFSTKAESCLYKSWGADIIGMTNMAEARLAREAEICYATVALITDYDSWHPEHDQVTAAMIIKNFTENVRTAKKVIAKVVPAIARDKELAQTPCRSALQDAIITRKEHIPKKKRQDLDILVRKYL